jgi:YgiT-type zinc finger domain-containing protein
MKCTMCGSEMEHVTGDLPFKVRPKSIVIVKGLPLWQCENCDEYLLDDDIMEQVDAMLANLRDGAEVEILSFAA